MFQLPRHLRQLEWSTERLRDERVRRLRRLVRHAQRHSPWHADRLAGVDADTLTEQTLTRLPIMTKSDLMDNFDVALTDRRLNLPLVEAYIERSARRNGIVTDARDAPELFRRHSETDDYLLGRYLAKSSSGSSGRKGSFVYDWDSWITWYLTVSRYSLRRDLRSRSKGELVTAALAPGPPGWLFSTARSQLFRLSILVPVHQIVEGLNRIQPDVLLGPSSALNLLSFEAVAGRLRISPKRITSFSEPLLAPIRTAISAAWDAPIENMWASTEAGGMGYTCDLGSHLHLTDDLLVIEPVDESGVPVRAGQPAAKLYVTNLYNMTQPLIRYEISDQITLLEETCPCGSGHRLIEDVHGRQEDSFDYGAVTLHFHTFSAVLHYTPNVMEYQVRQSAHGVDIDLRAHGPIDLTRLQLEVAQRMMNQGIQSPTVRANVVAFVPREESGKLKRFVPLEKQAR
jgi:phenylacetate-CoA ligase